MNPDPLSPVRHENDLDESKITADTAGKKAHSSRKSGVEEFIKKLENYDDNNDGMFTYDEFTHFCQEERGMSNDDEIFQIWKYFGGTKREAELSLESMNEVYKERQASKAAKAARRSRIKHGRARSQGNSPIKSQRILKSPMPPTVPETVNIKEVFIKCNDNATQSNSQPQDSLSLKQFRHCILELYPKAQTSDSKFEENVRECFDGVKSQKDGLFHYQRHIGGLQDEIDHYPNLTAFESNYHVLLQFIKQVYITDNDNENKENIEELNKKIQSLIGELEKLQNENESLRNKINSYESDIEKYQIYEKENEDKKQEIEKLKNKMEICNAQCNVWQTNCTSLQKRNQELSHEIGSLKQKIVLLEEDSLLDITAGELEDGHGGHNEDNNENKNKIASTQGSGSESGSSSNSDAETGSGSHSHQGDSVGAGGGKSPRRSRTAVIIEGVTNAMNVKLNQLMNDLEEKEKENSKYLSQKQEQEQIQQQLQDELQQLQQEQQQAQAKIHEAEKQALIQAQKAQQRENELNVLLKQAQTEVNNKQEKIDEKEKQIEQLNATLEFERKQAQEQAEKEQEREKERKKQRLEEREKHEEHVQQKAKQQRSEEAEAHAQARAQAQIQIQQAQEKHTKLDGLLKQTQGQLANAQQQINDINNLVAEKERHIEQLNTTLNHERAQAREQIEREKEREKEKDKEIEKQRQRVVELEQIQQIQKIQQQQQQQQSGKGNKQQREEEAEVQIQQIQQQHQQKHNELSALLTNKQQQIDDMTNLLNEKEEEIKRLVSTLDFERKQAETQIKAQSEAMGKIQTQLGTLLETTAILQTQSQSRTATEAEKEAAKKEQEAMASLLAEKDKEIEQLTTSLEFERKQAKEHAATQSQAIVQAQSEVNVLLKQKEAQVSQMEEIKNKNENEMNDLITEKEKEIQRLNSTLDYERKQAQLQAQQQAQSIAKMQNQTQKQTQALAQAQSLAQTQARALAQAQSLARKQQLQQLQQQQQLQDHQESPQANTLAFTDSHWIDTQRDNRLLESYLDSIIKQNSDMCALIAKLPQLHSSHTPTPPDNGEEISRVATVDKDTKDGKDVKETQPSGSESQTETETETHRDENINFDNEMKEFQPAKSKSKSHLVVDEENKRNSTDHSKDTQDVSVDFITDIATPNIHPNDLQAERYGIDNYSDHGHGTIATESVNDYLKEHSRMTVLLIEALLNELESRRKENEDLRQKLEISRLKEQEYVESGNHQSTKILKLHNNIVTKGDLHKIREEIVIKIQGVGNQQSPYKFYDVPPENNQNNKQQLSKVRKLFNNVVRARAQRTLPREPSNGELVDPKSDKKRNDKVKKKPKKRGSYLAVSGTDNNSKGTRSRNNSSSSNGSTSGPVVHERNTRDGSVVVSTAKYPYLTADGLKHDADNRDTIDNAYTMDEMLAILENEYENQTGISYKMLNLLQRELAMKTKEIDILKRKDNENIHAKYQIQLSKVVFEEIKNCVANSIRENVDELKNYKDDSNDLADKTLP